MAQDPETEAMRRARKTGSVHPHRVDEQAAVHESRVLEMLERSIYDLAMLPRPYHSYPSNFPSSLHPSLTV